MNRPVYISALSVLLFLGGTLIVLPLISPSARSAGLFLLTVITFGSLYFGASVSLWCGKKFGLYLASAVIIHQILVDGFKFFLWEFIGRPEYFDILTPIQYYLLYTAWFSVLFISLGALHTERAFQFLKLEREKKRFEFLKGASLGVLTFCLLLAATSIK